MFDLKKPLLGGALLLGLGLAASANRSETYTQEQLDLRAEFQADTEEEIPAYVLDLLTAPEADIRAWAQDRDLIPASMKRSGVYVAFLSGDQVVPPTAANEVGIGVAWLNKKETKLRYRLRQFGLNMEQDPADRTKPEDITACHLHSAPAGTNGPHVLNIFANPSEDDDDAKFNFKKNTMKGIYDDGDAFVTNPTGGDTKKLSDFLDALKNDEFYFQLHTVTVMTGEIRGQLIGL